MDKTERAVRVGRRKRDSKVESNDCPEIPDRAETSDIPSFPLGNEQTAFLTTSTAILKLIVSGFVHTSNQSLIKQEDTDDIQWLITVYKVSQQIDGSLITHTHTHTHTQVLHKC